MRKKFVTLFLVMLVLTTNLATTTTGAHSKEVSSSELYSKCLEIGSNFLYDYYYSIDMKKDIDMSKYFDNKELIQYLDLKHDIMKNRVVRTNCEISNFSVETSCYDSKVLDNKVEITYNVLVKHQYRGFDEMSESMQQVKLGFENINDLVSIIDYFEFTNFDINVILKQGKTVEALTLNSNDNSFYKLDFGKESNEILENIFAKENEFYDKLDSEAELYKNTEKQPSVGITSVSSTARSNMVTYATTNCSKTDPASGNSSKAPYYDFSSIQYAYDCTNFMSHCLLAGGASENRTSWYYDSLSARTPSWSGVNEFHSFITTNTSTGPKAEARALAYSCPSQYVNWESGDIVQLQEADYNYPGFGQSTMITGSYVMNSLLYIPVVTSRTADNWYTKNEVLTVKYPIDDDILAYRLIHLTGLT